MREQEAVHHLQQRARGLQLGQVPGVGDELERKSRLSQLRPRAAHSLPYLTRLEIHGSLAETDFITRLASIGIEMSPERWQLMKERYLSFKEDNRTNLRP